MQLDLIPRTKRILLGGAVHVPDWMPIDAQNSLLTLLRHWTSGGWYTPEMPNGTPMKHPLACVGYRWRCYEYFDALVPMPADLKLLAIQAVMDAGMGDYAMLTVDTGIVNYFPHGSSLGMHQDRSEHPSLIAQGSPIVTLSLGDSAIFRLGNAIDRGLPWQEVELRSGDLLVMGGDARSNFHGVMEILPNTAPPDLQMNPGRISLTMRQAFPKGGRP